MAKTTGVALLLSVLFSSAPARADLNGFLANLNVQAQADLNGFQVKVSAQFGVTVPQVQAVMQTVEKPADAFMVFQLGEMSSKPTDTVVQTYQSNKSKGWGVIAQQLGIKPGSPEFHALKNGDLALTGVRGGGKAGGGKGGGKGKGKK